LASFLCHEAACHIFDCSAFSTKNQIPSWPQCFGAEPSQQMIRISCSFKQIVLVAVGVALETLEVNFDCVALSLD